MYERQEKVPYTPKATLRINSHKRHNLHFMRSLKILQYNVQTSKDKVMAPLLADPRTHEFDIIAIQEPWKNPHIETTYCPARSPFYLLYPPEGRARSCFLINKKLDITSWEPGLLTPDLCSLQIRTENGSKLWIHNTYSQPPCSYSTTEYNTPISALPELLSEPGEHILLGDLNLHHPWWCGPRNPATHKAADQLIDTLQTHDMQLALPNGSVTWEAHGTASTIDLVFITRALQNRIIKCQVREDLEHGSDHYPIALEFTLNPIYATPTPQRNWKKMDHGEIATQAQSLNLPLLNSVEAIEQYTSYLLTFITNIIEKIPFKKRSKEATPWWNQEVEEAVKLERSARRRWRNSGENTHREEWQEAGKEKRKCIAQAKRKQFREAIAEAAESNNIWKLAKWGRTKAHLPPELPIMPVLTTPTSTAHTIQEKAEALKQRFYPNIKVDLSDIRDTSLFDESFPLNTLEIDHVATKKEVIRVLKRLRLFKAPGRDGIPNGLLKAMGPKLAQVITNLTTACWRLEYYPRKFKEACTIVLQKPGKPSYSDPGAWRPIALLSTIGKVIEALTAQRLSKAAEEYHLLPKTQMGGRKNRSTETALELLTEQIHTLWPSKKHVATLLSIDISGAFDTVNHIRLLEILRKKGLPPWIVRWIRAFLKNRSTTLVIQNQETALFEIDARVPQGSPLFPILFLFYNAALIEISNQPQRSLSSIGFADDINLLIYGPSIQANCRKLERIHKDLLKWAQQHGMKFNLQAGVKIEGMEEIKRPSKDIRILGV